jgi:MFS family permease
MNRTQNTWRLAAMMALVYAVQGSFWPLLAVHLTDLGIGGRGRGWIFATLAIGSLAAPFAAGQVVDRIMATQRLLALTYAVGTGLLILVASAFVSQVGWMFLVFLAFWLVVGPAYSLSNSLAMRNLGDPLSEFGWVRAWGTAGWMIAGWVVSLVMLFSGSTRMGQGAFEAIWVGAILALATSFYCLTLPHTPPLAVGPRGKHALRDSLDLVRQPDIAVLLITSFGVYLTAPTVYQVIPGYLERRGLPRAWISTTMTLGQLAEIATLAVLPWLLRRFGVKATLMLGIAAYFLRFLSLTLDPPLWLAVAGTVLHGVGIAGFVVGGALYIDSRCGDHVRASAQALFLVCMSGIGALLGNLMAGEIVGRTAPGDVLVFLIPCVIDGALLLYFLRGFRAPVSSMTWGGAGSVEPSSSALAARGPVARVGHLVTELADG